MLLPLQQYLSESTVHSFVHLTGNRRVYVKLFWAAAFLASISYCSLRVSEAYRRYVSGEVSTTIKAKALDFEFPDIYACSQMPVSGSYSVTLDAPDAETLRNYRRLVNISLAEHTGLDVEYFLDSYAVRLVNSLPYRFLIDKMAHKWIDQDIIYDLTMSDRKIHYSPSRLSCLKMTWTKTSRIELQSVSDSLILVLLLDPQLPRPFDKDTDIQSYNEGPLDLKPIDWDFTYGTDFVRSAGTRVFFVPKGHYPSDLNTQIVIGPGLQHRIQLKMQDIVYDESDFEGQCTPGVSDRIAFANPYSGAKETFEFSQGTCWYREIARQSLARFNCSVWPIPLAWEYRHMRSCFNLTAKNSSSTIAYTPLIFTDSLFSARSNISNEARNICENKKPCRNRVYSYQYASSTWPSNRTYQNFLVPIIQRYLINGPVPVPGAKYLVENSSGIAEARGSMTQIMITGAELRSSVTQMSFAYSFNSLVADVGGLLGLFLGMSLMSVLEVLELLHDWMEVARIRRRRRPPFSATVPIVQPTIRRSETASASSRSSECGGVISNELSLTDSGGNLKAISQSISTTGRIANSSPWT